MPPKRKGQYGLDRLPVKKKNIKLPLQADWWCDCEDNLPFCFNDRHNPGRSKPVEDSRPTIHTFLTLEIPGLSPYAGWSGLELVSKRANECVQREEQHKIWQREAEERSMVERQATKADRARQKALAHARLAFVSLKVPGLGSYVKEHGLESIIVQMGYLESTQRFDVWSFKSCTGARDMNQQQPRDPMPPELPAKVESPTESHSARSTSSSIKPLKPTSSILAPLLKINFGQSSIQHAPQEALEEVKNAQERHATAAQAVADAQSEYKAAREVLRAAKKEAGRLCKMLLDSDVATDRVAIRKRLAKALVEEERAFRGLEDTGRTVDEAQKVRGHAYRGVVEAQRKVDEYRAQVAKSEG